MADKEPANKKQKTSPKSPPTPKAKASASSRASQNDDTPQVRIQQVPVTMPAHERDKRRDTPTNAPIIDFITPEGDPAPPPPEREVGAAILRMVTPLPDGDPAQLPHRTSVRVRSCSRSGDESSSNSILSHGDIVACASCQSELKYGVHWRHFRKGETIGNRKDAWRRFRNIVEEPEVVSWYLGVTGMPSRRFWEEPSPHKLRFDAMFPLLVGKHMGRYEKNWLKLVKMVPGLKEASCNVGPGGERVRRGSIKFMYVCVKWVPPETPPHMRTGDLG